MSDLTIFNESCGVFPGVNAPQFFQLEQLVLISQKTGCQIPSLGLFGEASTGKTTSTKILAREAKYEFIVFNAVDIKSFEYIHDILYDKFYDTTGGFVPWSDGGLYIPSSKTLVLIDEAHKLKPSVQTQFLSALESKGPCSPESPNTFLTNNITWVFATTDPSSLVYPLTTRLHQITFDQYSTDDIKHIISMKHKNFSDEALTILAQCSKLVPRTAIRNADLLLATTESKTLITEEDAASFAKQFLNMETNGVDSIDKRILIYLNTYKKKVEPVDQISLAGFTKIKEQLETKGLTNLSKAEHKEYNRAKFQTIMLTEKINRAEPQPKSRQDISMACRLLDLKDLELRLSYLEKLSMIEKTPKGIILAKEYR